MLINDDEMMTVNMMRAVPYSQELIIKCWREK